MSDDFNRDYRQYNAGGSYDIHSQGAQAAQIARQDRQRQQREDERRRQQEYADRVRSAGQGETTWSGYRHSGARAQTPSAPTAPLTLGDTIKGCAYVAGLIALLYGLSVTNWSLPYTLLMTTVSAAAGAAVGVPLFVALKALGIAFRAALWLLKAGIFVVGALLLLHALGLVNVSHLLRQVSALVGG